MDDDFERQQVLTKFVLTLTDIYSNVNTQFCDLSIHSHLNAQTMKVYAISKPSELNSAFHRVIWIVRIRTDGIKDIDPVRQAERGHSQFSQRMKT